MIRSERNEAELAKICDGNLITFKDGKMKKQFIITVEENENSLIVDRENKGFNPIELIDLLQDELTIQIYHYNSKRKPQ